MSDCLNCGHKFTNEKAPDVCDTCGKEQPDGPDRGRLAGKSQGVARASEPPIYSHALPAPVPRESKG